MTTMFINTVATGQNINRLRVAAGLTVRDMQMAFGFSTPQAIYKWIHGNCQKVRLICRFRKERRRAGIRRSAQDTYSSIVQWPVHRTVYPKMRVRFPLGLLMRMWCNGSTLRLGRRGAVRIRHFQLPKCSSVVEHPSDMRKIIGANPFTSTCRW